MSEISTEVQEVPQTVGYGAELRGGKKHVIWPVVHAARLVVHPNTYFEEGAEAEILEHRDAGGSMLMLMTHFRRWEPVVIAQLADKHRTLQHIRYTTGITARDELFEAPVLGYIIRNSGAQRVKRTIEHPNETSEQKAARKESNQRTQAIGGYFLANGLNWLIFPEGGSKKIVEEDGRSIRVPRDPGRLLPLQRGFVYSLESMSKEDRERVKLLGITVHYGEGRLSSLRPTVHITRPEDPIEGTSEIRLYQGEKLLRRSLEQAIRLHKQR